MHNTSLSAEDHTSPHIPAGRVRRPAIFHVICICLLAASLLLKSELFAEAKTPSTNAWISHRGDLVVVDVDGKQTSFPLTALKDGSAIFSVKLAKRESVFLRIKEYQS